MPRATIPAEISPGEPFEGKRARGVAVRLALTPPPSAPPLAIWPEGIASTAARLSFPCLGLPPTAPLSSEGRHRGLVRAAQNAPYCAVYTGTDAPVGGGAAWVALAPRGP